MILPSEQYSLEPFSVSWKEVREPAAGHFLDAVINMPNQKKKIER